MSYGETRNHPLHGQQPLTVVVILQLGGLLLPLLPRLCLHLLVQLQGHHLGEQAEWILPGLAGLATLPEHLASVAGNIDRRVSGLA